MTYEGLRPLLHVQQAGPPVGRHLQSARGGRQSQKVLQILFHQQAQNDGAHSLIPRRVLQVMRMFLEMIDLTLLLFCGKSNFGR